MVCIAKIFIFFEKYVKYIRKITRAELLCSKHVASHRTSCYAFCAEYW